MGAGASGVRIRRSPTARRWRSGARRPPAEADAAHRCVIERNNERSGFQRTNRLKRSRCAGPFHSNGVGPHLRTVVVRSDLMAPLADRSARDSVVPAVAPFLSGAFGARSIQPRRRRSRWS